MYSIALLPLLAYIVWCALLFFLQDQMMFPAGAASGGSSEPWFDGAEILECVVESDVVAKGWLIPPADGWGDAPVAMTVFFHGNAELIGQQRRVAESYGSMGRATLLIEYRGYGDCGGSPSQSGIVSDSLSLIAQAESTGRIDSGDVAYHGRSLGGAVAAQVAAEREPSVLILESSFTHAGWFASRFWIPSVLVKHPFETRKVLPSLDCSIHLFHGSADRIVPSEHSERLHALVPSSTLTLYPGIGHNDFPGTNHEAEFWSLIASALSTDS